MSFNEKFIRDIANQAFIELGASATPDSVKKYVEEKIKNSPIEPIKSDGTSGRAILTSFGLNRPGVVAALTALLSDSKCDVLDISQKIMQEFFTVIMMIDISNSPKSLKDLQDDLVLLAQTHSIKAYLQHEDVFTFMHRI